MLVCNGKSQRQATENLKAFLGEQSWEFVAWFAICIHLLFVSFDTLGC